MFRFKRDAIESTDIVLLFFVVLDFAVLWFDCSNIMNRILCSTYFVDQR